MGKKVTGIKFWKLERADGKVVTYSSDTWKLNFKHDEGIAETSLCKWKNSRKLRNSWLNVLLKVGDQ